MFLAAIMTYVFSEDLSLHPRLNGPESSGQGNANLRRPSHNGPYN